MEALGSLVTDSVWDPKAVGPDDLCYGISKTYNARATEVSKAQGFYPTVQPYIDVLNPERDEGQTVPRAPENAKETGFIDKMQPILDQKNLGTSSSMTDSRRLKLICKGGLEQTKKLGGNIHFFLEGMTQESVFGDCKNNTTSKELRHLYRRWDKLGGNTRFYDDTSHTTVPPWENPKTRKPWDDYAERRKLKPPKKEPSPWDGMY